ncbi:hypothetical protein LPN01_06150 [Sphingomonas sp. A2-49]|uniref:hypothetical protein n=1 Tax=Sphingomonas sp. A2-49 TaxID=1391375 RepID=UPI0021D08C87|nr:hypothetical protein [Sphingomonas sp. A2-49]MCU6453653.1 hypothetical protein [Sphingomonas sp. A2-49]
MPILLSLLLIAGQQQPSAAAAAADRFALDLPAAQAPVPVAPAAATGFSLDTPIATLIADPRAKAVLDRDVPGLSSDENLPKFEGLSLRKLAPLSGGQMTATLLAQVERDLAAIEGAPPPIKKVESRRALPVGR